MKQTARILGTPRQPTKARATLLLLRAGTLAAALASAGAMSGCGLKGPLYLPAPGADTSGAASAPSAPSTSSTPTAP